MHKLISLKFTQINNKINRECYWVKTFIAYLQEMIIHVAEEVFKKGYFLFKLAGVSLECVKVLCSISFYVL